MPPVISTSQGTANGCYPLQMLSGSYNIYIQKQIERLLETFQQHSE